MASPRLRCRFGFHAMHPWALPEEIQRNLLAGRWAFSATKCVYCEWSTFKAVRVTRTDGKAGSLRG